MALTPKQERFVQEYLVDLNATQAAIRAGYKEKTAGAIGSENLKKPEIQMALKKALKDREKRTEVTQDYVLQKLKEIADQDASDDPGSTLKMGNKIKALELLGKHVGAFEHRETPDQRQAAEHSALIAAIKEMDDADS